MLGLSPLPSPLSVPASASASASESASDVSGNGRNRVSGSNQRQRQGQRQCQRGGRRGEDATAVEGSRMEEPPGHGANLVEEAESPPRSGGLKDSGCEKQPEVGVSLLGGAVGDPPVLEPIPARSAMTFGDACGFSRAPAFRAARPGRPGGPASRRRRGRSWRTGGAATAPATRAAACIVAGANAQGRASRGCPAGHCARGVTVVSALLSTMSSPARPVSSGAQKRFWSSLRGGVQVLRSTGLPGRAARRRAAGAVARGEPGKLRPRRRRERRPASWLERMLRGAPPGGARLDIVRSAWRT